MTEAKRRGVGDGGSSDDINYMNLFVHYCECCEFASVMADTKLCSFLHATVTGKFHFD